MVRAGPQASRRRLLRWSCSALALAAAWPPSRASAALIDEGRRPGWRFCPRCGVMFDSFSEDNACAAGGRHVARGFDFRLPYRGPETPTAQRGWFACNHCRALFYAGYQQKGRCAANSGYTRDRGHEWDRTFHYVLPHDIRAMPTAEANWRFCSKCFAMFYDGWPTKGRCPAGEEHFAQGFNFVLPHSG